MKKYKSFQVLTMFVLSLCVLQGLAVEETWTHRRNAEARLAAKAQAKQEAADWISFRARSRRILSNPGTERELLAELRQIKSSAILTDVQRAKRHIDLTNIPATISSPRLRQFGDHALDREAYRTRLLELYIAMVNWVKDFDETGKVDTGSYWMKHALVRVEQLLLLIETGFAPRGMNIVTRPYIQSILEPTLISLFGAFVERSGSIASEAQRLTIFTEVLLESRKYLRNGRYGVLLRYSAGNGVGALASLNPIRILGFIVMGIWQGKDQGNWTQELERHLITDRDTPILVNSYPALTQKALTESIKAIGCPFVLNELKLKD